jgi:hypothetical protein
MERELKLPKYRVLPPILGTLVLFLLSLIYWRKGEELWREAASRAEALGLRVIRTSMRWRRLGILLRLNQEVWVEKWQPPLWGAYTIYHELAHFMLHCERLPISWEEAEADLVAFHCLSNKLPTMLRWAMWKATMEEIAEVAACRGPDLVIIREGAIKEAVARLNEWGRRNDGENDGEG